MKKMFIAVIMLLLCVHSFAQAKSSSNKGYKVSSIDSLSYIKIDKVIYYQTPLEMYYGKLTSDQFEPDWYNAFCSNRNADRFKDNPKEVLKYIHSSINLTDSEVVNIIRHPKPRPNYLLPYSYFFGEVRLTHKPTGEKIVLVLEKDNETKLPDFTMKLPDEKNNPNEKLDSIRMQAITWNLFIEQDGIIKFPDPSYVDSLLTSNSEYFIKPNLDDFKNMLYRSKSYRVSNRENGKRKFGTMEKGAKGFVRNAESNKP